MSDAGFQMITVVLYAGGIVSFVGLLIAGRSFLAERADYVRTPVSPLARHPERTAIGGLCAVEFAGANAERIGAWYAPSRNGAAVILVHGTQAERSSLLFETGCLADAGFGVLALDLPGQGESSGRTRWGMPERGAIRAAIDFLASRADVDGLRIGGFGLSMGAYVLLQSAVLDARMRSVTLVASPADVVAHNWRAADQWGLLTQIPCYLALRAYGQSPDLCPRDIIGKVAPRAVLIVAGELDPLVPPSVGRELFAAAGQPKEWWLVPGAGHADFAAVAGREYGARLTEFFSRTLLGG